MDPEKTDIALKKKPKYEWVAVRKNCRHCLNKRKEIRTWPGRQSIMVWCPHCMTRVRVKEKVKSVGNGQEAVGIKAEDDAG